MRRTQKTGGVHVAQLEFNPWIMRCVRSSIPGSQARLDVEPDSTSGAACATEGSFGAVRTRITTLTGSQCDGIVLSTSGSVIRVAVPGCDDAKEFCWQGRQWYSEDGDSVEIEFFAIEESEPDFASAIANQSGASSFCGTPMPAWVN